MHGEPPNLRSARFEDYPRIVELESSNDMRVQSEPQWRGMWLDNPLWARLSASWPIGWVLETVAGDVVGSIVNVPTLYRFEGRELICANGRAWVCAPQYRGFAVLLMDEYFSQAGADLFVNTTVGPTATETLEQYSIHVPLGDWKSIAFWVTGYRAFARAALTKLGVPMAGLLAYPAAAGLWVRDAVRGKGLPGSADSTGVESADGFDSRFDSFWEELVRQNPGKLLGARDSRTMNWHFAAPLCEKRLWVFTASRAGLMRAYCVVKREDQDGRMPRMRVVDYQSVVMEEDLLPGLLGAALQRCGAEWMGMLEHFGCGLPKMRAFDQCAPYRRQVAHWPFYYQTRDVGLRNELGKPEVWDPSSFDGDASFE